MSCFIFHRLSRIVIALFGVMALSACGAFSDNSTSTYRFRMTVEVETPDGIRSGSSVYEVTAASADPLLPEQAARNWAVKGQAVAVDLPDGKTLFAILKTGAHFGDMMGLSMNTLYPAFREEGYDVVGVAKLLSERTASGATAVVAPDDYPMLVTFDDIDTPTSVREVDPAALTATLGEGITLKRITVELTNEPVTTGIDEQLGWLSQYPEPRLDSDYLGSTNPNLSQRLSHGEFLQGTIR